MISLFQAAMAIHTEKNQHLGEPRERTARLTHQNQYVAASWTPGSMKSTTAFRLSVTAVVGLKIPHVTWFGSAYVTMLNALWNTSILNGSSCFWLQQVALLWWAIFLLACPRYYHSYINMKNYSNKGTHYMPRNGRINNKLAVRLAKKECAVYLTIMRC